MGHPTTYNNHSAKTSQDPVELDGTMLVHFSASCFLAADSTQAIPTFDVSKRGAGRLQAETARDWRFALYGLDFWLKSV